MVGSSMLMHIHNLLVSPCSSRAAPETMSGAPNLPATAAAGGAAGCRSGCGGAGGSAARTAASALLRVLADLRWLPWTVQPELLHCCIAAPHSRRSPASHGLPQAPGGIVCVLNAGRRLQARHILVKLVSLMCGELMLSNVCERRAWLLRRSLCAGTRVKCPLPPPSPQVGS